MTNVAMVELKVKKLKTQISSIREEVTVTEWKTTTEEVRGWMDFELAEGFLIFTTVDSTIAAAYPQKRVVQFTTSNED